MNPWTGSNTCDAQRLLTKSQMWGKRWHATVLAGGWVGVRSGREKRLLGKTPQTAPPGQDLNVVNAATKVDPRAMAEPGSRYPEGGGPPQAHIFHMLSPPVFDRATCFGSECTGCFEMHQSDRGGARGQLLYSRIFAVSSLSLISVD